jgi:hypothetical protein
MADADLHVTATFVDNPFSPGVIGNYSGLVQGPTAAPETSGLLGVAVSKTGMATGKLWIGGKPFTIKGSFNGSGRLDTIIVAAKQPQVLASLTLDTNPNGSQRIIGTITNSAGVSTVQATRCPFDSKNNPVTAQFAGNFTFYIPPFTIAGATQNAAALPPIGDDTAPRPQGNGVGTVSISTAGVVKWLGTLGDGSPAAQTTFLDAQHRWPLYVALYKGRGYVGGDVAHDPAALASDLSAELNWMKPPNPLDRYFPGGFKYSGHALLGVKYVAPAKGQRVLPGFDAVPANAGPLVMEEGNLAQPGLSSTLTLLPTNATQVASATNTKISIITKTGAVNGSFVFPITRQVTPIKGVILQGKIGKAIGFFPGSTINGTSLQTGRLEFAPE